MFKKNVWGGVITTPLCTGRVNNSDGCRSLGGGFGGREGLFDEWIFNTAFSFAMSTALE